MKVARVPICLSLCVLVSCSGKGIADPTYLFDGYTGITYTDIYGDPNGPIDPSDWQLSYNSQAGLLSSESPENQTSLSKVIPVGFAARPAYPNPSNDNFHLTFGIPTTTGYLITVLDFKGRVILSIPGESHAGEFQVQINLSSEKEGVYRVFYTLGAISGYGDIWLNKSVNRLRSF